MCKTELYRNSFFPSTTRLWNDLPDSMQTTTSLSAFKRFLSAPDHVVPPYYYYFSGCRNEQVIHCRLRLGMSNLNYDLFNRHLQGNRSCLCGFDFETAEHYLLHCPIYAHVRQTTINALPCIWTDIDTLLFGNPHLRCEDNEIIFSHVHDYISRSRRFD